MNKEKAKEIVRILEALVGITEVSKILNTFIPAFEHGIDKVDGRKYLHGNFNVTGTASGRMSSNNPNLQQIPSTGTSYAGLIKQIFKAPDGWLFCGADFASLEDRISALTTKDPNKLKVYEEGYDGHSLRAYYYFKNEIPDIELAEKEDICYKAKVGSTYVYFKSSDTIEFNQQIYTGKNFYDLVSNKEL